MHIQTWLSYICLKKYKQEHAICIALYSAFYFNLHYIPEVMAKVLLTHFPIRKPKLSRIPSESWVSECWGCQQPGAEERRGADQRSRRLQSCPRRANCFGGQTRWYEVREWFPKKVRTNLRHSSTAPRGAKHLGRDKATLSQELG